MGLLRILCNIVVFVAGMELATVLKGGGGDGGEGGRAGWRWRWRAGGGTALVSKHNPH